MALSLDQRVEAPGLAGSTARLSREARDGGLGAEMPFCGQGKHGGHVTGFGSLPGSHVNGHSQDCGTAAATW